MVFQSYALFPNMTVAGNIGYGLKMGLKFGKLPKPAGYFDYGVGALLLAGSEMANLVK